MDRNQCIDNANKVIQKANKSGKPHAVFVNGIHGIDEGLYIHIVNIEREGFSIRCKENPDRLAGVYDKYADPDDVADDIEVTAGAFK